MPAPKQWVDDPKELKQCWLRKADSKAHERSEGMAYLSLYYSRPDWADVEVAATTGDFVQFRKYGFNLLQKAAGAVRSEVCKALEAELVPVGATLDALLNAKTFNRILTSRFETENFPDLAARLFLDGELCGEGYGVWEPDWNADLRARRLPPLDSFFEAQRTRFVCKRHLDRRIVHVTYADTDDKAEAIAKADASHPDYIVGVDSYEGMSGEDLITIYEGWAAPLGDGKRKLPGRHVVQLETGLILLDEEWDEPVPVFSCRYDSGFRDDESASLGRYVAPYAVWVNALAKAYHEQLQGNKTVVEHLPTCKVEFENTSWQYVEVDQIGQFKVHSMDAAVAQEGKEALRILDENCLSERGINSGMAAGEPPPAFKSGLAIQEWRKSLLSRLSGQQREYEGMWLNSLRICAIRMPRLYKNRKLQIKAMNTGMMEYLDFSKIDVSEYEANFTFQVVSGISLTNSGKLEIFSQFQQSGSGLVDELDMVEAMDGPDWEAKKEELLSARRLIRMQIEEARDYGRWMPPVDGQDYEEGARKAIAAHAAAMLKRNSEGKCIYPRKHLQMLWRLYRLFLARANGKPPQLPSQPVDSQANAQIDAAVVQQAPAQLGPVSVPEPAPQPPPGALPA